MDEVQDEKKRFIRQTKKKIQKRKKKFLKLKKEFLKQKKKISGFIARSKKRGFIGTMKAAARKLLKRNKV